MISCNPVTALDWAYRQCEPQAANDSIYRKPSASRVIVTPRKRLKRNSDGGIAQDPAVIGVAHDSGRVKLDRLDQVMMASKIIGIAEGQTRQVSNWLIWAYSPSEDYRKHREKIDCVIALGNIYFLSNHWLVSRWLSSHKMERNRKRSQVVAMACIYNYREKLAGRGAKFTTHDILDRAGGGNWTRDYKPIVVFFDSVIDLWNRNGLGAIYEMLRKENSD